ncbi:uncharacterized protein Dwil_GK20758, isoform B [Drosophila willistoni]|uniref:Uncharacterized protein, isoform B n=1 Tax=Drosophila willistoni TaxID=7260 RepID=A0A0Q9WZF7_DROWI|nr:uncharacterized protein Dwil_GK20758, isoform B [Drosophila willistoni]
MYKLWSLFGCWLLVLLHLCPGTTEAQSSKLEFSQRLSVFSNNLYNQLSLLKPEENVVFSPFSIQTCAAMARLGAKKETAAELDRGLGLVSDTKKMAESFHRALSTYKKSTILRIANRIYVMKGFKLRKHFNRLLTKQFYSSAESLDFGNNKKAAASINGWVAKKTNNLIKDVIDPSSLSSASRIVLVNAIHFKGNWVHQFAVKATRSEPFYMKDGKSLKVPMMNIEETFGHAELPELDATALQLPYKDSDLSMLIILPNRKTDLLQLEGKLRSTKLSEITMKLNQTKVMVKLPKFKSEFQMELTDVFKKLGMTRIFLNNADFSGMLQNPQGLQVSSIMHKAFIDVNEHGTEAAAATAIVTSFKSLAISPQPVHFHADHPFVYYILNKDDYVLFAGKLLKPKGDA